MNLELGQHCNTLQSSCQCRRDTFGDDDDDCRVLANRPRLEVWSSCANVILPLIPLQPSITTQQAAGADVGEAGGGGADVGGAGGGEADVAGAEGAEEDPAHQHHGWDGELILFLPISCLQPAISYISE